MKPTRKSDRENPLQDITKTTSFSEISRERFQHEIRVAQQPFNDMKMTWYQGAISWINTILTALNIENVDFLWTFFGSMLAAQDQIKQNVQKIFGEKIEDDWKETYKDIAQKGNAYTSEASKEEREILDRKIQGIIDTIRTKYLNEGHERIAENEKTKPLGTSKEEN